MKEATGELNMTVVTVVAIAAVGAFFYAVIWPGIRTALARNTCANMCPEGDVTGVNINEQTCTCGNGEIINYGDEGE